MSVLAAIAVLVGWGVAPGCAIASLVTGPIVDPKRDPERFLAVAIAAGFSSWTLLASVVASVGWLGRPAAWAGALILGAASVAVLRIRRPNPIGQLAQLACRPFLAFIGGITATALPIGRWLFVDRDTLVGSTPWYYSDLVRQTVQAHGQPRWSLEWATRVRFLDDYPGFSAGAGIATAAGSAGSLAGEHVVIVAVLVSTALAIGLLLRAFGVSRFGAVLGTVVAMSSGVFAYKLLSFRPEAMGYVLAILVPVLAIDWMETRRPLLVVVGALAFGALGQIHGIDWVLSGILMVAALLAFTVIRSSRGKGVVRSALMFAGSAAVVWLLISGVLGGGLSGTTKVSGLPVITNHVDPTFSFFALTSGNPARIVPSTAELAGSSLGSGLLGLTWTWSLGLTLVSLTVMIGAALRGGREVNRRALRLLAFALVTFALMAAVGWALVIRWETYVPRRTGFGRLFHLWPLALGVVVGGAAAILIEWLPSRVRAVGRVVAVGAVGALALHTLGPLADVAAQHPPDGQSAAIRALDIPADATVLLNSYTESFPTFAAGLHPVLNGRAPYTERDLLTRANTLLDDARAFFGSVRSPLPCRGITHVLVATDAKYRFATRVVFPADLAAMAINPDLRQIGSVPGIVLFAVRPGALAGHLDCSSASGPT